jgi:hypothetical protein
MEAVCSSEKSADFQRNIRCYVYPGRQTLKGKRKQQKKGLSCIRTCDLSVAAFYLPAKFLLALASTVILDSRSHGTHDHVLLSDCFWSLQNPLNVDCWPKCRGLKLHAPYNTRLPWQAYLFISLQIRSEFNEYFLHLIYVIWILHRQQKDQARSKMIYAAGLLTCFRMLAGSKGPSHSSGC